MNPPPPPPDDAQQLDYRTYTPAPKLPTVDAGTFVVCALAAGVMTIALLAVVPRFSAMFRDMGMKLPLATVLLVRLSRAATEGWIALAWVLAAAPVAMSIPLGRLGRRILRGALYLLLLLFAAWVVVSLFMPYISMIQSVSSSTRKP